MQGTRLFDQPAQLFSPLRSTYRVGLFNKFKSYRRDRDDKRLGKTVALVRNPKAIKEDRAAAIDFLSELDEPEKAVPALLSRFEYSLEHGINDTREKEACMAGILRFGASAIPLVKQHLIETSRIAWPIKALKSLGDDEQVVEVLKSALDFGDVSFDQAKVDKNYDILCYLMEYKLAGFVGKLAHFLNDPDERVRFAATETLIEQDDSTVPRLLERFIGDESAENTRIRQAVITAFLRHQWPLEEPGKFPGGVVVEGLHVNTQKRLEVRQ